MAALGERFRPEPAAQASCDRMRASDALQTTSSSLRVRQTVIPERLSCN